MDFKLHVSSSPHVYARQDTSRIMRDVLIALLPATAAGVYFFGLRALMLICVSIATCVVAEYVMQKVFHRGGSIQDLSAAVTGLLFAMNLPASAPWWMAVVGSLFAIVIVKMIFGGIGHNFMNPALAGRAFLLACWPVMMTARFIVPSGIFQAGVDAVTAATPMALLKQGALAIPDMLPLMAIGKIGGCIGETSAIALVLGGIYLLVKRVIRWHIPVTYIATVFVMTFLLGGFDPLYSVAHLLGGGLMLGAIYMATDYTTSPMTSKGQIIMGLGCGILTVLIRMYGGYPEGVSYAILLMNIAVPLIDRFTKPKVLGEVKRHA